MTTKAEARRAISAHQAAIDRGSSKAADHQRSIDWYRKKFNIPTPVSFGRDNPRMAETQRAMHDLIKHGGEPPKVE